MYFLDLEFTPLKLEDKEKLEPFLNKYSKKLSSYTFASLFAWNSVYSYEWTFIEKETLLISLNVENKKKHLLEPIGIFSEEAQKKLLNALHKIPYPIQIYAVSETFIKKNPNFCSNFNNVNDRKYANYLYKTKDLAAIEGRRYEKKRNLIAQSKNLYEWSLEKMTEKCHPFCPKILEEIGLKKKGNISTELTNELKALDVMLVYFKELELKGYVITVNTVPVAFSIYSKMNQNTADIYFEKADKTFKGLYQIINHEIAKIIEFEGYEFINREEDLGIEGLRQAKLSYHPTELISYHILTFKKS